MVNWLPVPSNDHLVTRATTLIQWQKLFQAPEPKPNSQTVKKYMYIFFLLPLLWPYLLPLFTTTAYHQNRNLFPRTQRMMALSYV